MYDFERIVKAAESCEFHNAFASDIKLCENALGMGGLMGCLLYTSPSPRD